MALELRQQLKLSQQLVMTPQLQQAIRLLQLSRLELVETIQQELLENPFLEESHDQNSQDLEIGQDDNRLADDADEIYTKEIAQNADWEDYMGDLSSSTRQNSSHEYELSEEGMNLEGRHSTKDTLDGHLLWQLRLSRLSEEQKEIGEIIIGNLNSSGYLAATLEDLEEICQKEIPKIEEVLFKIQEFDPVGVAARTPQECLMVQIKVLGYDRDPILVSLVTEHLEDLEGKRYKPLLRKFKLGLEDLKEYLDIIQSLNPLPGASFGSSEPCYTSIDVFVYPLGDDFLIALNDEGLPQLHLSSLYEDSLLAKASDAEREYFQEKHRSASWLIKSLQQRQKTLYKVMESIVKYQQDFFRHGVSQLRPLILKDIADDIEMHESTVSRITSNKYAATPYGIFELKYFFNSSLTLDDGTEVGSESVKALIKKYIDDEDPKAPLSDERIGEMLKEVLKVNIARRTVAKYRTAMDIPSSSKRRSFF